MKRFIFLSILLLLCASMALAGGRLYREVKSVGPAAIHTTAWIPVYDAAEVGVTLITNKDTINTDVWIQYATNTVLSSAVYDTTITNYSWVGEVKQTTLATASLAKVIVTKQIATSALLGFPMMRLVMYNHATDSVGTASTPATLVVDIIKRTY